MCTTYFMNVAWFLCVETAEASRTLDGEIRQGRRTEAKGTRHPESIKGKGSGETSIPDQASMYGRYRYSGIHWCSIIEPNPRDASC